MLTNSQTPKLETLQAPDDLDSSFKTRIKVLAKALLFLLTGKNQFHLVLTGGIVMNVPFYQFSYWYKKPGQKGWSNHAVSFDGEDATIYLNAKQVKSTRAE